MHQILSFSPDHFQGGRSVFVGPGVTIGRGAVVGARASVFSDLPEMTVSAGNPARVLRDRETNG